MSVPVQLTRAQLAKIRRALDPTDWRLWRRWRDGETQRAIAADEGLSIHVVRSRIRRAEWAAHALSGLGAPEERRDPKRGIAPKGPVARRLTPEDVAAIRASTETRAALAARFGCGLATIGNVQTGVTYADLPGARPPRSRRGAASVHAKLDDATVRAIILSAASSRATAERYGVTQSCVAQIWAGRLWRHVSREGMPTRTRQSRYAPDDA